MMEIHLVLQNTLLILWSYIVYLLITNKKQMPLNIFGVMLCSSALMIYVVSTGMITDYSRHETVWARWEWYAVDYLFALVYIKVINMARKIDIMLNLFSNKK